MKPESAAILRHIVDTMFMIVLAATIVLVAWMITNAYCETFIGRIAQLSYGYMALVVISIATVLGWFAPIKVMASARSLKLLPKHWGLVVRVALTCVLTLPLACLIGLLKVETRQLAVHIVGIIVLEGSILLVVSMLLAKVNLWLRDKSIRIKKTFDADDAPIRALEENLFPEHEVTARRILARLELGKGQRVRGPNVALIGPYGAGKTSLCNLIKDICRKERNKRKDSPTLFCRFEAWKFLTPDAAVRGLLDQIVNEIQQVVDCSGLSSLPEEYLDALRSQPNAWLGMIAVLLRKRRSPAEIVGSVQDVLLRLGKRVVVFIDDFDRLESKSKETQQAIAAALNELQNLTSVQYILCVGPLREGSGADLLKLTRFQELMPELSGQEVVERIRNLRDEAIGAEQAMYYPWDFMNEGNDDPLLYFPHREALSKTLVFKLVNLIVTPRKLKAVESEMSEKWNGGLKGEISWYDMLLMSTLKVGEPRVFEWVLREQEVFLDEGIHITNPNEEEKQEAKTEIEKKLRELIEIKTKPRLELVQQVLLGLFPNFMKGLRGLEQWMTRGEPQQWEQCIALQPNYGISYFRRYMSGCVPSTEVPDQPILQYIRNITDNDFEPKEFQQQYLDSGHKLTNDLNRFVQFSGLLSEELASKVCDCILDWMCDRQHWTVSGQEEEYVSWVMTDVKSIVESAGQFELPLARRQISHYRQRTRDLSQWAKERLKSIVSRDAIVAIQFSNYVGMGLMGERDAKGSLGTLLKADFLDRQEAFWESAKGKRYYMGWLLGALKYNDDYETIREQVTESVLKIVEADMSDEFAGGVIMSLVDYRYSAGKPDLVEGYEISVNEQANQQKFDMDMLLPVLKQWEDRKFSDQVVSKAFEHLMAAYAEETKVQGN